ncbi:hypothetical protein U1Q18_026745 [Sarracenia purpurea var. burkii]
MKARVCELCDGKASLYCPSDSAFLCWNCDAKVHEANFLVARHVRYTVCFECKGLTNYRLYGVGFQPLLQRICRSCLPRSPVDEPDSLSSSSSTCISNAESCSTPSKKIAFDGLNIKMDKAVSSSSVTYQSSERSYFPVRFFGEGKAKTLGWKSDIPRPNNVERKAECVLVNWCRKLGIGGISGVAVVPVAIKGFGVCWNGQTVLPIRVSLAASLWFSLRLCGNILAPTWQVLKRLEEISGVPAKLILAANYKLARLFTKSNRGPQNYQLDPDPDPDPEEA